jgi:hypothetical protein
VDAAGNVSPLSDSASVSTPNASVLFHDGFESNDLSAWSFAAGLVVQPDEVFAGAFAARATPIASSPPYALERLTTPEREVYYETRFKVLDQPSGNINLLRFRAANASFSALATLFVTGADRIGLRNDVAATSTTSTALARRGQWHTLQAHVLVNGTSSIVEVWLDGVLVPSLSTSANFGIYTGVGQLELSAKPSGTSTYDVAFDEVFFDRRPLTDATAPDAPTGVTAVARSGQRVDLAWVPGHDHVGVTGYDIYRDGGKVATVGSVTAWTDTTVAPLTSYTYRLVARDAAGNVSSPSDSVSVTTPDVFTDGFETGDMSRWTSTNGLVVQSAIAGTGTFAARATSNGSAGASAVEVLDSPTGELYYRVRFYVVSRGPNSVGLLRIRNASNGAIVSTLLTSTGKVALRNDVTGQTTTSSLAASSGAWHEIKLHVAVSAGAPRIDVWLDGQAAASRTDSLGTAPAAKLELGDPSTARTFDVALDNVVASLSP